MGSVIAKILVAHRHANRVVQIGLWMAFPFVLFACASFTTVRQHPEFDVRRVAAKTAMLVPLDVVVVRGSSLSTGTQLPEEAAKAGKDLSILVAAELSQRGFEVKSGQAQENAIGDTKDNPAHTTAVKHMHEQLAAAMYSNRPMPTPQALAYRYTLGPEVAALAKQAGVGSLAFVRLRMCKRSGGDVAAETGKNLLVGLATLGMFVPSNKPSGWVALQVALVDGETGDVLWGNQVSELSFTLGGEPDFLNNLKGMVADLFKPYPLL
jgi:hypothetical protein